jgi:S-DNA-T family DNA segregation ATPase FtsK/SpoIIIE
MTVLFPESFIKKTKRFLSGSFFLLFFIFFIISLYTYREEDFSLNTYTQDLELNYFGVFGSVVADFFVQIFGVCSYLVSLIFVYLSFVFFFNSKVVFNKIVFFIGVIISICCFFEERAFHNFPLMGGMISSLPFEKKYFGIFLFFFSLIGLFYKFFFFKKKDNEKKKLLSEKIIYVAEKTSLKKKEPTLYSRENLFTNELKKALNELSIEGEIIEQYQGPVVCSFLFKTISQIQALRLKNLAYELRELLLVSSVRVVDQGNCSLIEIANKNPETISLDNCASADRSKFKLPLILGKNTIDETVCVDIVKLPHMLIGGAKGKTNFLNHILQTQHQAEFRLVDDPRRGEWQEHKDRLLDPAIALKTIIKDVEKRYRSMSKMGVKNIEEFNDALIKHHTLKRTIQTGFDCETGKPIFENQALHYQSFPYQIVLVQELMTIAATEEEQDYLSRCCSLARGAGIHFIAATKYRPSPLMQETFLAKLSFKMASRFESLALIDGAEYLCGKGDGLFKNGNTQRVHTVLSEFHESISFKKETSGLK